MLDDCSEVTGPGCRYLLTVRVGVRVRVAVRPGMGRRRRRPAGRPGGGRLAGRAADIQGLCLSRPRRVRLLTRPAGARMRGAAAGVGPGAGGAGPTVTLRTPPHGRDRARGSRAVYGFSTACRRSRQQNALPFAASGRPVKHQRFINEFCGNFLSFFFPYVSSNGERNCIYIV